jgi:cbb3-type cytochrome oxidase maturation protein
MSVVLILIPVSVVVAACFLAGFIWAVRNGQYEDTCTPSMRMLADDAVVKEKKQDLKETE